MIYLNNNNILFTATKKKYTIKTHTCLITENLYYIAFVQYRVSVFVGLVQLINNML